MCRYRLVGPSDWLAHGTQGFSSGGLLARKGCIPPGRSTGISSPAVGTFPDGRNGRLDGRGAAYLVILTSLAVVDHAHPD